MKLIENMERTSLLDAIRNMYEEFYGDEISTEDAQAIANKLSISDIISLDKAWENGDAETVKGLISNDVVEYTMPGRGNVTSAASTRQNAQKKPATQTATGSNQNTSTSSNYSTGVKNGVTTQNNVNVNDTEVTNAPQDNEEEVEESSNVINFLEELQKRAGLK